MEPFPSEIRELNLAEHRALRDAATRLKEQVQDCHCSSLPGPIVCVIASLLDRVRKHLDEEDATLGPVLQHLDPWGPLRAANLCERRRVELTRIAEMLGRLAKPLRDGPLWSHLLGFIDWMEGELFAEERQVLNPYSVGDDLREEMESRVAIGRWENEGGSGSSSRRLGARCDSGGRL